MEKEERPQPPRPRAAPGGGAKRTTEKSPLDLGKPQGSGGGSSLPTPSWSKHGPSYIGEPSKQDAPVQPLQRGGRPGESKGGFTEQEMSEFSLQDPPLNLRVRDLES